MSLDNYIHGKVIGKGSYGEVWLARHKRDKKQYVIKRLKLQKSTERERKAAEQEAKLLSKLKHPNIVLYKDSFETSEGCLYIAMQYCEGGDLYTRLKKQKGSPLPERQLVEWFVQISMALQYMHERNILHRDLKTQNIFLTRSEIIKIGDLGIARVLDSPQDMATTLIGTPYYMSPELFLSKPYNQKSDIWALGCCVYEMATLKHAFNAKDMNSLVYRILRDKMPPMPDIYSAELVSLIKSMLHKNPEKRPSIDRILRNAYVRKNIQQFLEETKAKHRPRSATKSSHMPSSGSRNPTPAARAVSVQIKADRLDIPDSSQNELRSDKLSQVDIPVVSQEPAKPQTPSSSIKSSKSESMEKPCIENKKDSVIAQNNQLPSYKAGPSGDGQIVKSDRMQIDIVPYESKKQNYNNCDLNGVNKLEYQNVNNSNNDNNVCKKSLEIIDPVQGDTTPCSSSGGTPTAEHDTVILSTLKQVKSQPDTISSDSKTKPDSAVSSSSSDVSSDQKKRKVRRRRDSDKETEHKTNKAPSRPLPVAKPRPLPPPPKLEPDGHLPLKRSDLLGRDAEMPKIINSRSSGSSKSSKSSSTSASSSKDTDENGPYCEDIDAPTPRDSLPNMSARARRRQQKDSSVSWSQERPMSARNVKLVRPESAEKQPVKAPQQNASSPTKVRLSDGHHRQPSLADESSSQDDEEGETEVNKKREKRENKEIKNFISLLDTTLRLNKTSDEAAVIANDVIDSRIPEEASSELMTPRPRRPSLSIPSADTLAHTGRLMYRIDLLKKDCLQAVGFEKMKHAFKILERIEDDEVEPKLVSLLGKDMFDLYAGKIWQLKFFEDSAKSYSHN